MRLDAAGKPLDPVSFVIATANVPGFLIAGTGAEVFVMVLLPFDDSGLVSYGIVRIDATGVVTRLPTRFSTDDLTQVAAISAGGGNILVITTDASTIRLTLFDDDGTLVRGNVPVVPAVGQPGNVDVSPAGDGFLIVYTDSIDGRVRALHASTSAIRDGSIAPAFDQAATQQVARNVHVAVNGGHALAIWTDGSVAHGMPLSLNGTPTTSLPADLGAFSFVSSIVPYADGFLATLFESSSGNGCNLVVVRLTANGAVVSAARTEKVCPAASAAASGSFAVVVWVEYDEAEVTVAAPLLDGRLGASNIVSLAPAGNQHVHALFATASGSVAVWSEAGPANRVMFGRVDAAGAPMDGAGFRLHDSLDNQGAVGAAFNGNDLLVVWLEPTGRFIHTSLYAAVVSTTAPLPARVLHLTDDVADFDPFDNHPTAASWDGREWVVVWRDKARELAALHLAPSGDPIEVLPVPLTSPPAKPYVADWSPRISWNGNEYLLVWKRQRYYVSPYSMGEVLPAQSGDIAARRFTRALVPDGPPIDIALASGDLTNNPIDAGTPDVAFSNGVWLVAWTTIDFSNTIPNGVFYARIDSSGARLDPLNGRLIMADSSPPHVAAAADAWIAAIDRTLMTISGDGVTTRESLPSGQIEAVAVRGLIPMLAYTVTTDDDTRAWIHVNPERRRAVR